MRRRWKKIALALVIILAGGAVRIPIEQRHTAEMRAQNVLQKPLGLSLRDDLGQSLFIATMGGLRSPVASVMELRSITPWMKGDWGIVEECYSICTRLQPREEHYWDLRAWHQACNARDSYLWESRLTETNRQIRAQQSVENGINILKEGLQRLPESWKLWQQLAWYTSMQFNQKPDYCAAAEYYTRAASIPGAPVGVNKRQAAYQLARVPEKEIEAWERLLEFYKEPSSRVPTVEIELVYLFYVRKIHERLPSAVLPADLFRLFVPGSVLSPRDQQRRQFLIEGVERRVRPEGIKGRGPQIQSPNLPTHR